MKKNILIVACLALFLPSITFAGEFPDGVNLSNGVVGAYNVNDTTTATQYSLSTAHSQGTMIYASSSHDSYIWYIDATDEPITSGDLFDEYTAGGFASDAAGYTEVGK